MEEWTTSEHRVSQRIKDRQLKQVLSHSIKSLPSTISEMKQFADKSRERNRQKKNDTWRSIWDLQKRENKGWWNIRKRRKRWKKNQLWLVSLFMLPKLLTRRRLALEMDNSWDLSRMTTLSKWIIILRFSLRISWFLTTTWAVTKKTTST